MRSFSLRSESIPYFLGVSFLRANRIILVSPWVSDITVDIPITDKVKADSLRLTEAIHKFPENEFTLVTSNDSFNDYLIERVKDDVEIRTVDNLHAKAIVTEDLVYVGSANITKSGVNTNVELAHVIENTYGDADTFVEEEIQIEI